MATTPIIPMSERTGRGGLLNLRDRLLANEATDYSQQLDIAQVAARIADMDNSNDIDPGDIASLFLNQLI